MKRTFWCLAFLLASAAAETHAQSAGCVLIGNPDTDQRVWRLCPNGAAFEQEYRYWGNRSSFYPIRTEYAPCRWESATNSWSCRTVRYACTPSSCSRAH